MPLVESKLIEIAATIIGETGMAVLLFDGTRKARLPRSFVRYDDSTKVASMPTWLATEKRLGMIERRQHHGPTSR
jgi:hypothetical protein